MFSGASAKSNDEQGKSSGRKRDWLNIGRTYADTYISDDSDEEIAIRERKYEAKRQVVVAPIKKSRQELRKPLPPPKESAVFEIDQGCDQDNLLYGTLADKDKPRYYLVKRKILHDNENSIRYFDPKQQPIRRLYYSDLERKHLDIEASFIQVEPFKDIADDDEEAKTQEQRLESFIMSQNKRFNEELRASPQNVELWIKYIAAQEHEGTFVKNKHKQRSVILEKQQAILQKAIRANPTSKALQKMSWLMTIQHTEGSELISELEKRIQMDPDNEMLWMLIIQRTQEQFSTFSLTRMRNLYARILQTIPSGDDMHASQVLFFTLLCSLEVKSGYTERGIGLMQALIEFNRGMPAALASAPLHSLKRAFEAFWECDLPRYGEEGHVAWSTWNEEAPGKPIEPMHQTTKLLPSMELFIDGLSKASRDLMNEMQPPLHLKHDGKHTFNSDETKESNSDENDPMHQHAQPGEEYVWSNLHGYRIPVQDAQDSVEYQRILQELRSIRPTTVKKQKKQDLANHDERLDYDPVSVDDTHMHLLYEEELLQATQWSPLHPRSPTDAALIEAQPDRVLLFEEIQPFLFVLDSKWHDQLLLSYLQLLGVKHRQRQSVDYLQWMYDDDFSSNEMVRTCFEMLQNRLRIVSDPQDLLHRVLHHDLTISAATLQDPTKVTHVRNLLWQTKNLELLMEFETTLAMNLKQPDIPRALAKEILGTSPTCMSLWEKYAYMEWHLGNAKQVIKICDKTIESLTSQSLEQHRFLYLRIRMECFEKPLSAEALWRGVYILHRAFHPEEESLSKVWKRIEKKKHASNTIISASALRQLRLRLQQQVNQESEAFISRKTNDSIHRPVLPYVIYSNCIVLLAVEGHVAALKYLKKWIDTAKSNCKQNRRALEPDAWFHVLEWLLAAYLDLLNRLNSIPRQWRHETYLAMTVMPHHATFVQIFVDAEQRNTMNQQVRRTVQEAMRASRLHFDAVSPMIHIMHLLGEVHRLKKLNEMEVEEKCCAMHLWGSVAISRIRRCFEDAVDNNSWRSQGNAMLWRLYLRFEIQVGQVQQAIKVFYRGIYKCPWSKELYLDSLRLLRPYLSNENVQEIMGFLMGKELYLRYES